MDIKVINRDARNKAISVLAEVAQQDLDIYSMEIFSACALNELSLDDLLWATRRLEKVIADANAVLEGSKHE